MKNVKARVEGNKLFLEIDLTQNLGPSKSGKSNLTATSAGIQPVPGVDGVSMGINVFRKHQ